MGGSSPAGEHTLDQHVPRLAHAASAAAAAATCRRLVPTIQQRSRNDGDVQPDPYPLLLVAGQAWPSYTLSTDAHMQSLRLSTLAAARALLVSLKNHWLSALGALRARALSQTNVWISTLGATSAGLLEVCS